LKTTIENPDKMRDNADKERTDKTEYGHEITYLSKIKRFNKGDENLANDILIELRNISKEFPGVLALDDVNMQIKTGHIHALVGENGAGKSTLMKILSGTYQNYAGSIMIGGQKVHLRNEKDAFSQGISIVAQELNYVADQTIAENLFLGRAPLQNGGMFIDEKKRNQDTADLLKLMKLDYSPNTLMKKLSVAQRQMIEILKSISRQCKVIIMDEPTSALTNKESRILFDNIRELKKQNIGFVFITHRLEEVFEICDEYTVLRDGKWIGSGDIGDVSPDKLISMMVGRKIDDIYPSIPACSTETILKVNNLNSAQVYENISFEIHKGEILGFAGMMGAGRSEIARAIFGMDQADSGEVILEGKKLKLRSTRDGISAGIAMVTEDRSVYGFVGVRSIKENIKLPNRDIYSARGLWKEDKADESVTSIMKELAIKASDSGTLVNTLSGGNQQKVVLAKWLVRNVKLLILDEPTRGIDVGAKQEIYKLICRLSEEGMSILLISSDMPEVLSMSHRIAVIAHGKLAGIFSRKEATQDLIMKTIVEAR
jgi:ABC-type sugar transport system ATPase subunit